MARGEDDFDREPDSVNDEHDETDSICDCCGEACLPEDTFGCQCGSTVCSDCVREISEDEFVCSECCLIDTPDEEDT